MTLQIDLSIGPVQGFVAQSRRTRDLWGSSYLLSFLSAHTMRGICAAGGKIIRPSVDADPLFNRVCAEQVGGPSSGAAPRIGSVPNHFVAELDAGADPAAVAQAGVAALEAAWQRVQQAVWHRYVEAHASIGQGTSEIWTRQTSDFWEVLWVAVDTGATGGLLARRKHWRSHRLPDEPGDKCTLMPDFQELSGLVRAQGEPSRKQQDEFWRRLQRDVGSLDLRPDERLCAIALVKRLFPKVAQDAIGWSLDTTSWPSTAGLAASPWLQHVCLAAPPEAAAFADALRQSIPGNAIQGSPQAIPGLAKLRGPLLGIDANYLQSTFLADERLCPLKTGAPAEVRTDLTRLLRALEKARDPDGKSFGRAPVFYALLLADGDRLGQLVGTLGGDVVGTALARFTEAVPGIVRSHGGVTVYAGGDDVLAMLPVPSALACASALSECYRRCFREGKAGANASLSAALLFAHVRLPLGGVIREAHRLLDDVAKDQNGRDSLAAALIKRGGLNNLWVTTWERPAAGGTSQPASDQLQQLVEALSHDLSQPGLSSSLLYRLRDTLSLLCNWPQWGPGVWGDIPNDLDLHSFLRAEVTNSLLDQGMKETDAIALSDRITDRLLPLLHPSRAGASMGRRRQVGVDALLMARFLAASAQEDDDA